MASQFSLFKKQKFVSMFFTQFLGAFNDNVFKQALLLVLTYTAATKMGVKVSLLNNLAAMLFILPYFLFSALAGQIADNYEKSSLTKKIKLLEIIIMVSAAIGFIFEWYWFLFLALFLMGTHSTFFGPIKYSYIPEVMNDNELVSANGLFQMGTSLAILTGMMMAGFLAGLANSLYWISGAVIVIAILGYIASCFIPKTITPVANKIDWNILRTSLTTIKYLYSLPLLFFVIMGNSWFWFYGATFLTQTPEFGKVILHGNESVVILLLTLFSVGTALGSILCKSLSKNQVSLKLLPFGILGLTLFAIDLFFALQYYAKHLTAAQDVYFSIGEILKQKGSIRVFLDLFLLGISSGIYIVPLYAFMQAYAPSEHRATIVGANNIFNALFMVTSAIFSMIILGQFNLSISTLFFITGLINLMVGVVIYKKLTFYKDSMPMVKGNLMM